MKWELFSTEHFNIYQSPCGPPLVILHLGLHFPLPHSFFHSFICLWSQHGYLFPSIFRFDTHISIILALGSTRQSRNCSVFNSNIFFIYEKLNRPISANIFLTYKKLFNMHTCVGNIGFDDNKEPVAFIEHCINIESLKVTLQ